MLRPHGVPQMRLCGAVPLELTSWSFLYLIEPLGLSRKARLVTAEAAQRANPTTKSCRSPAIPPLTAAITLENIWERLYARLLPAAPTNQPTSP